MKKKKGIASTALIYDRDEARLALKNERIFSSESVNTVQVSQRQIGILRTN